MKYSRGGSVRRLSILMLLAGLMSLAGCSWGRGGTKAPQPPISITLVPDSTVVNVGQTVNVNANVYDQRDQGATWTISPINFGALSNVTNHSVTYTAPPNFSVATTVTISATSITNPNITSSVAILVSPIITSLSPLAAQTVNEGGQIPIASFVTNDLTFQGVTWTLSPATGAGSLANSTPSSVSYIAPATVAQPTIVNVTAASIENSTATASLQITVLPAGAGINVNVITVDGGPVPGQVHANGAFTSVTICNPNSTTACQTVGGILVDTGSYGLRILQSQIPLLKLSKFGDGIGNTLENCASSADGSYLWGPVSAADVYIGGETASSALVQVISSSVAAAPDSCANGGTSNANTPQLLGANGILGVGPEPTDCTIAGVNYCDGSVQSTPPNLYYKCPSTGCATTDAAVVVAKNQQVTNPVSLFAQDNNGVILQLPPVSGTQASVAGTMIFGIGTQTNNQLGSATLFTMDSHDNFTTIYNGQNLTSSFIDSGSNALYFPDSLPDCTASAGFFCPPSLTGLSAIDQGATQGQSTVTFSVDNADSLFFTNPGNAVFGTLAGPEGTYNSCSQGNTSCTFDWGLPFFYGRTVYTAIDGQPVPAPAPKAPWWAY